MPQKTVALRGLQVRNFQSLAEIDLELGQLTVITGPSNAGKSAVVRALQAALFNRSGGEFVREGAEKTQVVLYFDGGTLRWLKPRKGGAEYSILQGEGVTVLTRVGKQMPPEIEALTGVREIQIETFKARLQFASQFDEPFLLAGTGGQAAKLLAKLSKLDVLVCLGPDSRVAMADGTRRSIRQIVMERDPSPVLSLECGRLVAKPVTGWHRNDLGDRRWVGLRLQRAAWVDARRRKVLWLTDDHPVFTPDGWRTAGVLRNGDLVVTEEPAPSSEQEEVIAGTLLGDGFFQRWGAGHIRPSLRLAQAADQEEWLLLKRQALEDLGFGSVKVSKRMVPMQDLLYCSTPTRACFVDTQARWYRDGQKVVDREMVERCFGPRLLATWYLDDGSVSRLGQVEFATDGFAVEDVRWLVDLLAKHGYIGWHSKANRIGLRVESARRFLRAIGHYVPPSMRYKLGRIQEAPFDDGLWQLQPAGRFVDVVQLHPEKGPAARLKSTYCIDVADTQMFFAGGLAVHNCAQVLAKRDGERTKRAGADAESLAAELKERLAAQPDYEDLLRRWQALTEREEILRVDEKRIAEGKVLAGRVQHLRKAQVAWVEKRLPERVAAVSGEAGRLTEAAQAVSAYQVAAGARTSTRRQLAAAVESQEAVEGELHEVLDGLEVCPVCGKPMK